MDEWKVFAWTAKRRLYDKRVFTLMCSQVINKLQNKTLVITEVLTKCWSVVQRKFSWCKSLLLFALFQWKLTSLCELFQLTKLLLHAAHKITRLIAEKIGVTWQSSSKHWIYIEGSFLLILLSSFYFQIKANLICKLKQHSFSFDFFPVGFGILKLKSWFSVWIPIWLRLISPTFRFLFHTTPTL